MPSPNSKERLNKKWLKTGMMISWILSTYPNDSWQLKVMRQRVWTKKSLQCVTLWSHRAMLGGLTKILKLHMFTKYTGYLYQWWLASNRCLSSVGGWKWVIWGERGIGRLLVEGQRGVYHVMSRTSCGQYLFEDEETYCSKACFEHQQYLSLKVAEHCFSSYSFRR